MPHFNILKSKHAKCRGTDLVIRTLALFLFLPGSCYILFRPLPALAQPANISHAVVKMLATQSIGGVTQTTVRYGTSVQGRPLIAYVLGDGDNVTLITGGIHGNEPSSPGVVRALHSYLLAHPAEWTGCKVIIAPNVNPDGDVGYPTPGSFGSYLWHKRGIACVTLEMPRISVAEGWARNKVALMNAIRFPFKAEARP